MSVSEQLAVTARVVRENELSSARPTLERGLIASGIAELIHRPKDQVPALDALRSLAVTLVAVGHFATEVVGGSPYTGAGHFFSLPVFRFGWTGVDLFFILSGYLIGRQLWRELGRDGTVDVPRFVLRRGFRIWPLYFFFVALTCIPAPHVPSLADVAFISNYQWGNVRGGWSLSTEEQFYIVVPLAVLLLRRKGAHVWTALIPTLIGGVLVARVLTARVLFAEGKSAADVKTMMYEPFHLRSEALFVGLLIALVSVMRPTWFARPRTAGFSRTGCAVAVMAAAVGVALRTASNVVFPFFGLALIFGGLTIWLLLDRSWVTRLLHGHGFYVISRLSYGIYLNHLLIMLWLSPWLLAVLAKQFGSGTLICVVTMLIVMTCSLVGAAVTFVFIEHPFLRLRGRVMQPRAQPVIATAGATV